MHKKYSNLYLDAMDKSAGLVGFTSNFIQAGSCGVIASICTSIWTEPKYFRVVSTIRYFPFPALYFALKDAIKAGWFPRANPRTEFGKFSLINFVSGGLGGAGAILIIHPLLYCRSRIRSLSSENLNLKGSVKCLINQALGPRGVFVFFTGVSVLGNMPYWGVYFGVYDSLREKNPWGAELGFIGFISKFTVAQFSTVAALFASSPFDTVRLRMISQETKPKEQRFKWRSVECFANIVKTEGPLALFKRTKSGPQTLRHALTLALYDQFQGLCGIKLPSK
jgi:solute carrier family 25 (adenine nucleotide translocator) protein 4/5/6/31